MTKSHLACYNGDVGKTTRTDKRVCDNCQRRLAVFTTSADEGPFRGRFAVCRVCKADHEAVRFNDAFASYRPVFTKGGF